jgi:predicted oxidoreductase
MTTLAPTPRTRQLGKSGIFASTLAWGMWRFQGDDLVAARRLVDAAFEAGITLFDTADVYGCDTAAGFGSAEALFGRVLSEDRSLRDRMVLATKGGIMPGIPYDSSAAYLESAIDASLRRLNTERIDLWQIHRPDILTHPHEIARAIEKARALGKVHAFGVSNFTPAQTRALMAHMPVHGLPLSTMQPEFSPLCLDPIADGSLDLSLEQNIAPLAWSPLGGGRIAVPTTPREHAVAAALDAVAEAQSVSRASVAYAWIMAYPAGAIPIVGSQNADRIREAADAWKVQWTRADWYAVLTASRGEPLP